MLQSLGVTKSWTQLSNWKQQESALWCLTCCTPGNCCRAGTHTWPCPSSTLISPGKSVTHRVCSWLSDPHWQSKGNLPCLSGGYVITHGCGGEGGVRILECVWGRSLHAWMMFKCVNSIRLTQCRCRTGGRSWGLGEGVRALALYQGT